ncbi:MAG: N-acetylmuramoyl-L-alanine amidase [Pseudomonadota bacterium]
MFFRTLSLFIAFILLFIQSVYGQSVRAIKADIVTPSGSQTEFYVRLTEKPAARRVSFLQNPDRLVIDLKNMRWKAASIHHKGIIQRVRYGVQPGNYGRIVLDLKGKANLQSFDIVPHPREKKMWLMVAKLTHQALSRPKKKAVVEEKKKKGVEKPRAELPFVEKEKAAQKKKSFKFTSDHKFRYYRKRPGEVLVMIDPGHGGNDPGAISVNKRQEKDIVLQFSRELYEKVNRTSGMRAILTRDKDFYIPLAERVALAQHYDADLFISIHADALNDKSIQGTTIYTLSDTASDDVAAQIARNENRSDIIAGVDIPEQEEAVADILIDLLQRETDGYSHDLAEQMITHVKRATKLMNKPHRTAGFAVLKAPDIPSVLLEIGYLTNPIDERKMIDYKWREKFIGEMVIAIKKWHLQRRKNLL